MKYQITAPLNNYILKCYDLSKNKLSKNMQYPAILLTSTDDTLLSQAIYELADRITSLNVIKQSGLTNCVNIKVEYTQDFKKEFQRMIHTLNTNAKYTNSYQGIVAIDLSDWVSDIETDEFVALLSYLKDTSKNRIYIFYSTKKEVKHLSSALRNYFSIDTHELKMEKVKQKYYYTITFLEDEYGIKIDESSQNKLYDTIVAMADSDNSTSLQSLNSFCREIACNALINNNKVILENTGANINNKTSSHQTKQNNIGLV